MFPVCEHREIFLADDPKRADANHDETSLLNFVWIRQREPHGEAAAGIAANFAEDFEGLEPLFRTAMRVHDLDCG